MFAHLTDLSGRLMKYGNPAAAYHLLAAALECAKLLRSPERLEQVERMASEFQGRLDSASPPHELSAASAGKRGTPALFNSLSRTANAASAGVRSEATVERQAQRHGEGTPGAA
jgi:hypothetical protein